MKFTHRETWTAFDEKSFTITKRGSSYDVTVSEYGHDRHLGSGQTLESAKLLCEQHVRPIKVKQRACNHEHTRSRHGSYNECLDCDAVVSDYELGIGR